MCGSRKALLTLPHGATPSALPGCFAGAVQTLVVTPVDLLKIRLQLQTALPGGPGYVGPLRLLRGILAREGLPGLYRGTLVTAARDVPSHGVYFAAYDLCRRALGGPGGDSGGAAVLWASGGVAGAVSWLSIYPLDVVKSRVQGSPNRYTGEAESTSLLRRNQLQPPGCPGLIRMLLSHNLTYFLTRSPGFVDCAVRSYRGEGGGVFFRGLGTTLARAFLVNGAIFSVYEAAHSRLGA